MKNITAQPDITIRQAMKKLSQFGKKCLVITDEKNLLLGTLSDGDVRKAILKGVTVGDPIQSVYQQKPTVLVEGKYSLVEAKKLFVNHKFDLIPVVNEKGLLVDTLFLEAVLKNGDSRQKEKLDVPVIIMAGGRGTRMEPFTKILPKPLVPVHEKPIIEHIIERFINVGCNEFHLTVNYKSRILKAYFEELQPDYGLHFVEEQEPLGTAGSLRFLDKQFDQPFFVTNCDIIIKADYRSLYDFHRKFGYDITLVASAKEYVIPYGTCELNSEGHLSHINEKPQYDFLINTGLYILNPDVLKLIPKNKFYHITHLIEDAKEQGKKVGVFPIDDDAWIDVGQWAEYRQAVDRL
jgi:dTDP-glucose pyrophosphorylase